MHKSICLVALLLLCSSQNNAQPAFINDRIDTLVSDLSPAQIIPQIRVDKLHFRKAAYRRINCGLTGREYHYIILELSAPQILSDQYLCIENTSLDTVSIYRLNDDKEDSLLYLGGQLVSYDTKRNYVWHTVSVEINTRPSYYCIAIKASQKNINLQYAVHHRDTLLKEYEGYDRFVFFYIGIAFMISAIMVLAFFLFKKTVFAAYLAYMVCISTWIVSHYGRIFPYVYPQIPVLNEIAKPVSSLGGALFLLIVLQSVFKQNLQQQQVLAKLVKRTRFILLASIALMFLLLFPELNSNVRTVLVTIWHLELLFLAALIIFIPFHFMATGSIAKIFSLAMFVIALTTLMQLFANTGFIKNYFLNEHGMAMGTLLENSIMAFGLFYGLLEERKSKELQVLALEAEQTATLKKLIAVQDDERKRIASDLHDNIGPLLAALKINFRRMMNVKEKQQQISLLAKMENIIDESILEIRNIAHNLMPKGLSTNGLINTLSAYFEDMEQLYNKKIAFTHHVQSIFEPELQMNIYRIISELVLNAAKHSNANVINVFVHADRKLVSILIDDDGCGFEIKRNGKKKSFGIESAESRVHYLKGTFHLETAAGKGTCVKIEIPLQGYQAKM